MYLQVRLYQVIETSTKLYLILELGDGGDMFDYIMRHDKGLHEDQAKEYFAQVYITQNKTNIAVKESLICILSVLLIIYMNFGL